MNKIIYVLSLLLIISTSLYSQDIDALLDDEMQEETTFSSAAFKSTRVINGHSIENLKKNHLDFRVSHRFGLIRSGISEYFGIDQATAHFSFEYGITDWLTAGIGRSTFNKTYDGYLKFRLIRQSSGVKNMPISIAFLSTTEAYTTDWSNPEQDNYLSSRFSYVNQLIIARKFNDKLTLQISPTIIHKNLVSTVLEPNDLYAIGISGRYKITQRMAITSEYYYAYRSSRVDLQAINPFSIGVDIETGGHVFQIMVTNAIAMRETGFMWGDYNSDFFAGDVHIGFNITRMFSFDKN